MKSKKFFFSTFLMFLLFGLLFFVVFRAVQAQVNLSPDVKGVVSSKVIERQKIILKKNLLNAKAVEIALLNPDLLVGKLDLRGRILTLGVELRTPVINRELSAYLKETGLQNASLLLQGVNIRESDLIGVREIALRDKALNLGSTLSAIELLNPSQELVLDGLTVG